MMAAKELMKTVSCKVLYGFGFGLGMGSALQLANIIGPGGSEAQSKSYKDNPGQCHNHPNYQCQHESSPTFNEKKMEKEKDATFEKI